MRTFIILVILTSISFAQTADIGSNKLEKPVADGHCTYMSMGPLAYSGTEDSDKAIRVSIFKYEIYNSIIVEELRFSGAENSNIEVINTYSIIDDEIIEKFGGESVKAVKFDVWISRDAFVLSTLGGKYIVSFMGDGVFEFRPLADDTVD